MIRYYVNGTEIEAPSSLFTFDQILKHVKDQHLGPTAVIREIHVDGRPFTPESLSNNESFGLTHDYEKIEIFGTLADIAVESIARAQDCLIKIEKAAPELIVKFQDFPEPEDFSNLGSFCEGFYFLGVILDKLMSIYKLKLDEITVRGATAQEHMMKFADAVTQLHDAQEKHEYLLIADTIEYEILPLVSVWKDIFEAVSQKIGQVH